MPGTNDEVAIRKLNNGYLLRASVPLGVPNAAIVFEVIKGNDAYTVTETAALTLTAMVTGPVTP